jgi:hypothetical protein
MKTPREILFERHQAAAPKLDAIRQTAVASVGDQRIKDSTAVTVRRYNWREFFFSLRWHLAGMSAVWLVVAFLSLNAGHSASLAASVPTQKIPSAQIIMASLRENRRQLLELMQPAEARGEQPQKPILPRPRSQRPCEILTA